MEHLSSLEILLGLIVTASSCGLIITAKDFYRMKVDIYKYIEAQYVTKDLLRSNVDSLKEEMAIFVEDQKDIKQKIDKIYEILLQRINQQ